jgi:uncharacterized protein (TIGR03118 family)
MDGSARLPFRHLHDVARFGKERQVTEVLDTWPISHTPTDFGHTCPLTLAHNPTLNCLSGKLDFFHPSFFPFRFRYSKQGPITPGSSRNLKNKSMGEKLKILSTVLPRITAAFAGASLTILFAFTAPAAAQHYNRVDLTVNPALVTPAAADPTVINTDPNLLNSWGLARSATSAWWIADNHAGVSTLYDGNGVPQKLVVTVPPPKDVTGSAAPTGVVFNATTSFQVATDQAAIFVFATEDGTISGWNPRVNPTEAIRMVNLPGKAIYKGLAIAQTPRGPFLYATNFVTGEVEVFNGAFKPVHLNGLAFRNPFLFGKSNWSAFGIQNVGGNIVVTYARRKPGETDEEHGAGFGRVAIFDTEGHFLNELQSGPWMNAPWGITLSPADFGAFSHRILIGNFGSGNIQVFNTITGRHEGQLLNADGSPLFIENVWALSFGSGTTGLFNELFFTSGPNDENDGLFGKITVVSTEQRGNAE